MMSEIIGHSRDAFLPEEGGAVKACQPFRAYPRTGFLTAEQLRQAYGLDPNGPINLKQFEDRENVVGMITNSKSMCQRTRLNIAANGNLTLTMDVGTAEIAQHSVTDYRTAISIKADALVLRDEMANSVVGYSLRELQVCERTAEVQDFSNAVFLSAVERAAATDRPLFTDPHNAVRFICDGDSDAAISDILAQQAEEPAKRHPDMIGGYEA